MCMSLHVHRPLIQSTPVGCIASQLHKRHQYTILNSTLIASSHAVRLLPRLVGWHPVYCSLSQKSYTILRKAADPLYDWMFLLGSLDIKRINRPQSLCVLTKIHKITAQLQTHQHNQYNHASAYNTEWSSPMYIGSPTYMKELLRAIRYEGERLIEYFFWGHSDLWELLSLSFVSSETSVSTVSFTGASALSFIGHGMAEALWLYGAPSLENMLGLLPPYAANSALVCEDGEGILLSSVGEGSTSYLLPTPL